MYNLLENGLYAIGTLRFNRIKNHVNIRQKLTARNFEKQVLVFSKAFHGSLVTLFVVYEQANKKCVPILTTSSDLAFNHYQDHPHFRKEHITITGCQFSRFLDDNHRTHMQHLYNLFMGGTDSWDGLKKKGSIARRYKNPPLWKRRFIHRLIEKMTTNAHILHKSHPQNAETNFTDFRFHLAAWFLKIDNSFFLSPNFSVKHYQTNKVRFRCDLCRSEGVITKFKCTFCRIRVCENHCDKFCRSCLTDLHLGAVNHIQINQTANTSKRYCDKSNCRNRTVFSCSYCLVPFCNKHRYVVCKMCSPILEG